MQGLVRLVLVHLPHCHTTLHPVPRLYLRARRHLQALGAGRLPSPHHKAPLLARWWPPQALAAPSPWLLVHQCQGRALRRKTKDCPAQPSLLMGFKNISILRICQSQLGHMTSWSHCWILQDLHDHHQSHDLLMLKAFRLWSQTSKNPDKGFIVSSRWIFPLRSMTCEAITAYFIIYMYMYIWITVKFLIVAAASIRNENIQHAKYFAKVRVSSIYMSFGRNITKSLLTWSSNLN